MAELTRNDIDLIETSEPLEIEREGSRLQAAFDSASIDSQKTNAFLSDKGHGIDLTEADEEHSLKNAVLDLLLTLVRHRVARKLRSSESRSTVARDLQLIYVRIDDVAPAIFFPLVQTIVQKASDIEIWKQVLQLIASSSRHTSPIIFSLPREIREMIYDYATHDFEARIESRSRRKRNAGILQTCQQMRTEALEQYYKNTTFRGWSSDCVEWLYTLDVVVRSRLRQISVNYVLQPGGKISFTDMHERINEVRNVRALSPDCDVEPHIMSLD